MCNTKLVLTIDQHSFLMYQKKLRKKRIKSLNKLSTNNCAELKKWVKIKGKVSN